MWVSVSINYMMAKDSVKKRLAERRRNVFTEFTYQLIHNDFIIYIKNTIVVANGGSDQWGILLLVLN
jgi:tyrosyl-tRNA synthetase